MMSAPDINKDSVTVSEKMIRIGTDKRAHENELKFASVDFVTYEHVIYSLRVAPRASHAVTSVSVVGASHSTP